MTDESVRQTFLVELGNVCYTFSKHLTQVEMVSGLSIFYLEMMHRQLHNPLEVINKLIELRKLHGSFANVKPD